MVGQRFGRWTVIAPSEVRKNGSKTWLMRCDCGTERDIVLAAAKCGQTQSCGCLNRERSSQKHKTHGLTKQPIYGVWKNMRNRCNKPHYHDFYLYGARGIKVCDRWNESFDAFYADMGNIPFEGAQIDRIDTNGDYCPENCKWSTAVDNMRNRRTNRYLTYNGETHCMSEWAEITGIRSGAIHSRLKAGWELDEVFNTPIMRGNRLKNVRIPQKAVML